MINPYFRSFKSISSSAPVASTCLVIRLGPNIRGPKQQFDQTTWSFDSGALKGILVLHAPSSEASELAATTCSQTLRALRGFATKIFWRACVTAFGSKVQRQQHQEELAAQQARSSCASWAMFGTCLEMHVASSQPRNRRSICSSRNLGNVGTLPRWN